MIRALRGAGCRVALVAANPGPARTLTPLVDRLFIVPAQRFQGGDLAGFDIEPYRRVLRQVAAELRPRVVIAENAWLAPALLPLPRGLQRWVDCHDILHASSEPSGTENFETPIVCTAQQEIELLAGADVIITSWYHDAGVLGSLLPRARVAAVTSPINLPRNFRRAPTAGGTVLAIGTPDAGNASLSEFASEVWPRVVARVPHARLTIVGASDLHQHYVSAAVVVCPDTSGGGVETTLLEALRLGKATVVTEAGCKGLPVPEHRAWLTTSSLSACADDIAGLLVDPAGRADLEHQAFAFGERHASAAFFRHQIDSLLPNRVIRRFAALVNRRPIEYANRTRKRPAGSSARARAGEPAPVAVTVLPQRSVSVIVPCAGWPDTLPACVDSLQKQVVGVPVEIIVVINGRWAVPASAGWPGVRMVHEPRLGPAAARNAGVRAATGDVLAFTDADCVAAPVWLASALETMRSGAAERIVAGAITRSGASQNWTSFYDSIMYLQQERYVRRSSACVTANLIVHRAVFERIGPFDEMFDEAAFEDWEWALRARRGGTLIEYAAGALVDHPCMASLSHLKRKVERLTRGELLLRRKLEGGASAQPLLVTLFAQIRRTSREHRVSGTDRIRLMCVGLVAGFWTWRAARNWQYNLPGHG
jgi:GT2 family glycosyltransferase